MRWVIFVMLAACGRIDFDPLPPPAGDAREGGIASGDQFSCTIRPDRSVVCWGDGRKGQLANSELLTHTSATPSLITNARLLDAGYFHACAVLLDDRLVCWGANGHGQLATTGVNPAATPIEVTGLPRPVAKLGLGASHTCVILDDASLWCWGRNGEGEIGVPDSSSDVPTPTHVLDDVVQAGGGEGFTCALRGDRSVWCWGRNGVGQLGDGTTTTRYMPQPIMGLTADRISVGDKHACAVDGGHFRCWGYNNNGELGDGTLTDRPSPVATSTLGGIVELDAGNDHNCALIDDGRVMCWGLGLDGALGDGTAMRNRAMPVAAMVTGRVVRVSTGGEHTCSLRDDGSVACWGYAGSGQLANGMLSEWAPRQVPLPGSAVWITVGDYHVCAVLTGTGQVYCWGENSSEQLGSGITDTVIATPVLVQNVTNVPIASAASNFSCASGASTSCWGGNYYGQLADGTTSRRSTAVTSMFGPADNMAGGDAFMCVHRAAGGVVCAGQNGHGQLGDGGTAARSMPYQVNLTNPVEVAAGSTHACARLSNNTISCWGDNREGQLGIGTETNIELPTAVAGTFSDLHGGGHHTCAVRTGSGDLACWGNNNNSELGDGTTTDRSTPTTITIPGTGTVAPFGLGDSHTCAARAGSLYCWGTNVRGELGDGTGIDRVSPQLVPTSFTVSALGAGIGSTCALDTAGTVWCWGDNARGQIGQGTLTRSLVPVEVSFP